MRSTLSTALVAVFSVAGAVVLVALFMAFAKRRRLGNAFRHRRMAENLIGGGGGDGGGGGYHPGHMYLPRSGHGHGGFQLEEQSTNFVNPVYETMYADDEDLLDSSGSGPILRVPTSPLAAVTESEGLLQVRSK